MIVDDLTMVKYLGKGIFGEVYLTKKKGTNAYYATKRIDKKMTNSEKIMKYFLNGIEILKELNHNNIIKFIEIKEDKGYYYLVEEYCNGQSLKICLDKFMEENEKPFPQEIIQYLMRQIVEAIKYLNNNNIIHRNLKLENILIKFDTEEDKSNLNLLKSNIKINDFLFSTKVNNNQTDASSPLNIDETILKIFKSKGIPFPDLSYDEKSDIWSLGSICYEMFTGKSMINCGHLEELFSKEEKGKYILPFSASKEIYEFMERMLKYNKKQRYKAEDLLKLPFFVKNVNNFERINIKDIKGKFDGKGINIDFMNNNYILYPNNVPDNNNFNIKDNFNNNNNNYNNNGNYINNNVNKKKMENEELINDLKSKQILNYIFDYIKDNTFKDKLFLHSKKLQKKFDIKLFRLKENYLKKINFDLDKYLYIESNLSEKDILTKKYHKFLEQNKIKKESLEKIIFEIFEEKDIKDIEEEEADKIRDNEKLINIESPLFELLSKTKNFGKIFTIYISQKMVDEYKDKYIQTFDRLNNINYTSIFYNLKDITKIDYLKEININFNKIKKLTIESDYKFNIEDEDKNKDIKKQIKHFLEILFSINNIENKLIYLNIKFKSYKINPELFENINNFKLLRYLYLENIEFENDFIIKLNLLKLLSIKLCENIKLSEISNEELKILKLTENRISDINILEKVNFKQLKELNLSHNYISDINILEKVNFKELKELYLSHNYISDINILEKVNFKELKVLNLSSNYISNINILEKVNFKKLNKLDLCGNKISDINILGKVNFKDLKELDLCVNKISDINILGKVNFKDLKELYLSFNKISDINILEKANLKKLKELYLSSNKISYIKILKKVNFKELNKLYLCRNKISDINILGKVNFKELKELDLSHNSISDINVLEKVNFKELKLLNLSRNYIPDINIIEKVNFQKLKVLNLSSNYISNINILEKVNFKELKVLNLSYNKISDINILEKVNFKELKELYLGSNNISDINILGKVNFIKLKELDLSHNQISDIKILEKVNFEELNELVLFNNYTSKINKLVKVNFYIKY